MHRCKLFQDTIEAVAKIKLEINKAFVKDPKGGKPTEIAEVAGPTTTVIVGFACGITAAVGLPTFGAATLAGAFVAGATLAVKIVDKRRKRANAKEVGNVVETAIDKAKMSSVFNCIVKDVAKELSRIFESQLFELQSDKQVKILAECAVDLMLDLKEKKKDTFDRDTLLRKVLKDGDMKKKGLLTRNEDVKWSAPAVFRKPGLRRMILGKNGAEFKYSAKPNKACKTWKYGYRGQFLQKKEYVNRIKEGENTPLISETPATHETHEDSCKNLCRDCSFHYENCTNGYYFGESDIDSEYTIPQGLPYEYRPLHVLIQCPEILGSFKQLQEEKPSLANFLKNKLSLPEHHRVYPVYRSHSPGKVPDLQKADLTQSDFSHSNFTDSCLEKCDFVKCVMLFAQLAGAKLSGSRFCDTLISHSNLENVVADHCEWTNTWILHSLANGARLEDVIPTIGGNCLDGTNTGDAITAKKTEFNCNEGGYK